MKYVCNHYRWAAPFTRGNRRPLLQIFDNSFKMSKRINDVKVGQEVNSGKNGKGMITTKTKRTVTVTFQNGNKVKNSYHHLIVKIRLQSNHKWK